MRRLLAATLTVAALLGAQLANRAPSSAASATPTLTVAIPGSFAGCDPSSPSTTPATLAVLSLVLPSAFTTAPTTSPEGDTSVVAQAELVNLDPQTVVYSISSGAAWPDGTAFGVGDLVRTWQERRSDRVVADLGYRQIAAMTPDATGREVTVTFRAPYADWESLFNLVVPAGTHASDCALPSKALDASIGPYEIVQATSTTITLAANRAWGGDAPAYPRVVVMTDPAAAPTRADDPRAVFLPSPSQSELQSVTSRGLYSSHLDHTTSIASMDFAVSGPLALVQGARAGVAHLIDRGGIVDSLLAPVDYTVSPAVSHLLGQGQEGYLGAPGVPVSQRTAPVEPLPGSTGFDAYGVPADPATAAAQLEGAGYRKGPSGWQTPDGATFALCLDLPAGDALLARAAAKITAQLRAQGVGVVRHVRPTVRDVTDDLRAGRCEAGLVVRDGDGFETHEAASWLAPSEPVPVDLSWTGVDDPTATSDADHASATLNPVEAQPSWNAMDARLWDLMVGLPLYSPSAYVAWSPSVAGVLPCTSVAGFVGQIPSLLQTTRRP